AATAATSIGGRDDVLPLATSTHVLSIWIDPPAPLSTITTNSSWLAPTRFATSATHDGVVTQSGATSLGSSRRTARPPVASTTSSALSASASSWLSASTRDASRLTAMPGTTAILIGAALAGPAIATAAARTVRRIYHPSS